ncbi:MAG: DNA/RNA nuclease SfsA [Pseudomonadota bacterium]
MEFDRPLISGTLERRYKRFLADVTLEDGRSVTAHCANTGAMLGVQMPGSEVWLEPNDNPKRKLNYSWKLIRADGAMVGIDTSVPNRVVGEALNQRAVSEFADYPIVRPELPYGKNSRVDFHLSGGEQPDVFLEVKNVHLCRKPGLAEFPDCVTTRGTKHLRDLADVAAKGHRAVMFYFVHRGDCDVLKMAEDLDPDYAKGLSDAVAAGVEVLAYKTHVRITDITLAEPIPVMV